VVNEWNHTRRFYNAYVGDPTDRGQLPIYAEMQVPLMAGAHDALLLELVDRAVVVAMGFVDWLHDDAHSCETPDKPSQTKEPAGVPPDGLTGRLESADCQQCVPVTLALSTRCRSQPGRCARSRSG